MSASAARAPQGEFAFTRLESSPSRLEKVLLPVPRTLGEVGVSDNQIPAIAEAVREEIELFDVLGRPVGLDEVRALLEAAA